jgi:hypothetical protein
VSQHLRVLLTDREMSAIQRLAKSERLTVGEWVRRVLEARTSRSVIEPETKLKAVRQAAKYAFPTADIEQMLSEIEQGRQRAISAGSICSASALSVLHELMQPEKRVVPPL